jgi:hypothetical protein
LRLWLPKKKWGSVAFIEEDFLKKVPLKLPSKTFNGEKGSLREERKKKAPTKP